MNNRDTRALLFNPKTPELRMATQLPNYGIMSGKLPPALFSKLKKEINGIEKDFKKADFFGKNLAGNIKKEYGLKKCHKDLEIFLVDVAKDYDKAFNFMKTIAYGNYDVPLFLGPLWVNFQTKGDFNPVHRHSGVYSFVGIIKVPYTDKEIEAGPGAASNYPMSGCLQFLYNNVLGGTEDFVYLATKEDEGSFFFFPAKFNHMVYPFFSSTKYRVTISGNLLLRYK